MTSPITVRMPSITGKEGYHFVVGPETAGPAVAIESGQFTDGLQPSPTETRFRIEAACEGYDRLPAGDEDLGAWANATGAQDVQAQGPIASNFEVRIKPPVLEAEDRMRIATIIGTQALCTIADAAAPSDIPTQLLESGVVFEHAEVITTQYVQPGRS